MDENKNLSVEDKEALEQLEMMVSEVNDMIKKIKHINKRASVLVVIDSDDMITKMSTGDLETIVECALNVITDSQESFSIAYRRLVELGIIE